MVSICRLCQSATLSRKYQFPRCEVTQCDDCGLVQVPVKPTPEDLQTLYDASYFDRGKYVDDAAMRAEQQRRLRWMQRCGVVPGSRVLDAGCATGVFISAALNEYEMWGNDISQFAIDQVARKHPEIATRLSAGPIESQDYEDAFFDAIVLWDVIEHLWEPVEIVKSFGRLLKPGGVLMMSTPNISAMVPKLMGRRWAFMTPPEHLCLFNRRTLSQLLVGGGFEPTAWMTRGKWVNGGFLIHKLQRIFPEIVPKRVVRWIQAGSFGRFLLYIPTGDVQYIAAQLRTASPCRARAA